MPEPKKTKVLHADPTALSTEPGVDATEVVTLVDFEHAIDAVRDKLRYKRAELRAIGRLCRAYPDQSTIAAVLELVEEVEHLRELRRAEPVVVEEAG